MLRLAETLLKSVLFSLLSIYQQRCVKRQQDYQNAIGKYYDRLSAVQARGSQASHTVSNLLNNLIHEVCKNLNKTETTLLNADLGRSLSIDYKSNR